MRREWTALENANPGFAPVHPAAHDPVMRRPGLERVWITEPRAARLLDLGNALYGPTLSLLEQAYGPATAKDRRYQLVNTAMELMYALGRVGRALVQLRPPRTAWFMPDLRSPLRATCAARAPRRCRGWFRNGWSS
jgi:hypothetical protein